MSRRVKPKPEGRVWQRNTWLNSSGTRTPPGASQKLVDRRAECDLLDRLVEDVRAGDSRMLVLFEASKPSRRTFDQNPSTKSYVN